MSTYILQLICLYILNKYKYLLFIKIANIKKHAFVASHLQFKILKAKCRMKQGSLLISLHARGNGDGAVGLYWQEPE